MDFYFHHGLLNGNSGMKQEQKDTRLKTYITGFILSVVLTLLAFSAVASHAYQTNFTIAVIVVLAVIQLFVQLIFFLHLAQESRPRWRLVALSFGVLVVAIVVFGSLWIMDHLNYNMMHSPQETKQYINKQGGF